MGVLKICPQCGTPELGNNEKCLDCGCYYRITDYNDTYWQGCDNAKKTWIIKKYCPDCDAESIVDRGRELRIEQEEAARLALQEREEKQLEYQIQLMEARRTKIAEIEEKNRQLPGVVFSICGNRGRSIDVYPYKVVITIDSTSLGAIVTGNATDGTKTIYFSDIIGVQYKSPGMTIGYLQLETAASMGDKNQSNFFSENTFTFGEETDEIKDMYDYILGVLDNYKARCLEK